MKPFNADIVEICTRSYGLQVLNDSEIQEFKKMLAS